MILANILMVLPSIALAGRPVFHDFSLAEMAQKSDLILVVTKARPFDISDKSSGCEKNSWRIKVKKSLKQDSRQIEGKTLQVQHSVTSFHDCTYRREDLTSSGVSFSADRYQPSKSTKAIIDSSEFIIFLAERQGKLELFADNSFEAIGKRQELQQILKKRP